MNFDVIVLGTGGVGSAAMYHLAHQGARVLGLDRFPTAHDRGSSHGESRVIRRSYFEHPDYVPLLNAAYELWDELGDQTGTQLLHRNGLLYFGSRDGAVVQGVLDSARQHQLIVEELSLAEAFDRFPGFTSPKNATALFEPDAGYLLVEECVDAHIQQAVSLGAQHQCDETILTWSATDNKVQVQTDKGRYAASKLVITAGCWTNELLGELQVPLRVLRKHLHWFPVAHDCYKANGNCPCYFIEADGGYFYGFPDIGGSGLKVAEHSGGTQTADPLNDDRQPETRDCRRIEAFLKKHLPDVPIKRRQHKVCFYTTTPDEHFIVDQHPQHNTVAFAAGLSGHGFKFASALGRILAELTLAGKPAVNIDFLRLSRNTLAGNHPNL